MVEHEDGHLLFLDKLSIVQRTAIADQFECNHGVTSRARLFTRTPAVNKRSVSDPSTRNMEAHAVTDGEMHHLHRYEACYAAGLRGHKSTCFGEGSGSSPEKPIFIDRGILCGVLDRYAFGASDYGMFHSVYELYDADAAGTLLGSLSRLFTEFLQHLVFTCRMDDLALPPEGNSRRAEIIEKGVGLGTEGAINNSLSLASVSGKEKPDVFPAGGRAEG
ncbi:hypothetical protein FOMPIDRAFT_82367 [Fomitopsis schrenkii]|uniref:DNA-directed RNA polymerase n=1 Tax=Fomitopsis schrenkii TaxID=2126942 RepID=S8DZ02_FOMSC|nr:hypothetical protein FOMPIDRAFT_82367 [Fomitopsis schrenkii]